MAMVFSEDVLFLHVPKAAGVSVTEYLLNVLPPPVSHVGPNPLGKIGRGESRHIPGKAHQNLREARAFLAERGIDIAAVPLILAVLRNPYDLAVSHYAFKRKPRVAYTLVNAEDAPNRPSPEEAAPPGDGLEAVVSALRPGTVARLAPAAGEVGRLEIAAFRTAARMRRPVEAWQDDGLLYLGLHEPVENKNEMHLRAASLDFREFVFETIRDDKANLLRRLHHYFLLDRKVPENLRIVRFERLAADLEEALASVGVSGAAPFPWLNRSERGSFERYYDAETEAIVYEQARWFFDQGFYERLSFDE